MCCPSPPQAASSQESALVAMQSEKNSTHKSFSTYICMRHMRYINIVPCIYRYILRDQTRLSSILLCFCLSFWLMMRLTMVVKWWHATIMPPSSVPSSYSLFLYFFYTKYRTLKLTVAMGAWRLQQVWITLAAESHKPAHSGPWCDLSFVART